MGGYDVCTCLRGNITNSKTPNTMNKTFIEEMKSR